MSIKTIVPIKPIKNSGKKIAAPADGDNPILAKKWKTPDSEKSVKRAPETWYWQPVNAIIKWMYT